MRIRRSVLVDSGRSQVFHVISRVVDRRILFEREEKEKMLLILRQLEFFSGVEMLAYCLMGNHFHLLIRVPAKPAEISDEEVERRMRYIYNEEKLSEFEEQIRQRESSGYVGYRSIFYDLMRNRMYDLSSFVKDMKLRFSKWYNAEHERVGTLWEERFKSVLVEGKENALMRVASYIELNPVRAGLVSDPGEYIWCSYGEAVAGGVRAQNGIIQLASGRGSDLSWGDAECNYRTKFQMRRMPKLGRNGGVSPPPEKGAGHDSEEPDQLETTRWRTFTRGLVIGSHEFIKKFYQSRRGYLPPNRKILSYDFSWHGDDELCTYRRMDK